MAPAETFSVVGPLGTVHEVKRVRLVRDAQAAWCEECGQVLHSPYWGPSTSRSAAPAGHRASGGVPGSRLVGTP